MMSTAPGLAAATAAQASRHVLALASSQGLWEGLSVSSSSVPAAAQAFSNTVASSDPRTRSSLECSTSGSENSGSSSSSGGGNSSGSSNIRTVVAQCGWRASQFQVPCSVWHQQLRGYAAKSKGGAKPAPAAVKPAKTPTVDPYAPPVWKMKRVPRSVKGDMVAHLTGPQKALLQQLKPSTSSGPLRSLRQLGWPLGQKQVLSLLHDQLADVAGTNVQVVPFMLPDMFQSAVSLASVVKDYLTDGKGMAQVEQALLMMIANMPAGEIPFEGIKVAIKGRMSGKGGMTSRKVWQWGRTSTATLSDPVDYAHEAVITRAGYIGIKVWIRYKRSHMEEQAQHSSRSLISLQQLMSMPTPTALPSRSSSAWWNTPGPLQPRQHRVWECFRPGYDPLTATLASHQQLPVAIGSSPTAAVREQGSERPGST